MLSCPCLRESHQGRPDTFTEMRGVDVDLDVLAHMASILNSVSGDLPTRGNPTQTSCPRSRCVHSPSNSSSYIPLIPQTPRHRKP